jgi:hypothetical protein
MLAKSFFDKPRFEPANPRDIVGAGAEIKWPRALREIIKGESRITELKMSVYDSGVVDRERRSKIAPCRLQQAIGIPNSLPTTNMTAATQGRSRH